MKRLLLFLCALAVSSFTQLFAAVNASDLTKALDSPAGVVFTPGSGLTIKNKGAKYDQMYDGVVCIGATFLEMNADKGKGKDDRSQRIVSSFDFTVKGAGTMTFNLRAATYGWNDDCFLMYEGDINDEIFSDSSGYWEKKYKEDGEQYGGLYGEEFFENECSVNLGTDCYTHTVHCVVLKPYTTDYEDPGKDDSMEDQYLAWKVCLDNFVWEPLGNDDIMRFDPETGATFGANGIDVELVSDYDPGVFKVYYTTDGSTPSSSHGTLYNYNEGADMIHLTGDSTIVVRAAVYDGRTLLDNSLMATYTRRPAPAAPTCELGTPVPFAETMTVRFADAVADVVFHYTTDGSDPTIQSPQGSTCEVPTGVATTIKVLAELEGDVSSITTFKVTPPTISGIGWIADGVVAKAPQFDESLTLTWNGTGDEELYLRFGDEVEQYTAPIDFGPADSGLSFDVQVCSATKGISAVETYSVRRSRAEEWVRASDFQPGWQLWGATKQVSVAQGQALAEWLKPFGLGVANGLARVNTIEGGRAYWVWGPVAEKPAGLQQRTLGDATPVDGNLWRLVSEGAEWKWDAAKGFFVPTSTGAGYKK